VKFRRKLLWLTRKRVWETTRMGKTKLTGRRREAISNEPIAQQIPRPPCRQIRRTNVQKFKPKASKRKTAKRLQNPMTSENQARRQNKEIAFKGVHKKKNVVHTQCEQGFGALTLRLGGTPCSPPVRAKMDPEMKVSESLGEEMPQESDGNPRGKRSRRYGEGVSREGFHLYASQPAGRERDFHFRK